MFSDYRKQHTDEWAGVLFFFRFFFDFLLFLCLLGVELESATVGFVVGSFPPSLSRVSPSSLSTGAGGAGAGTGAAGAGVDFLRSSPSESFEQRQNHRKINCKIFDGRKI